MTTGSFSDIHPLGGGWSTRNYAITKSWSGTNGKTETFKGFEREKWNSYIMSYSYIGNQFGSTDQPLNVNGGVNLLPVWSNDDEFMLQTRLAKAIRGHDFNLAVNAAQAGQVSSMVVSNIQSFVSCIRNLKRGNFADAARSLGTGPPRPSRVARMRTKDISGRWLEMQYGWLPAISDTYEAAKAYESITKDRSYTVIASFKRRSKLDTSLNPSLYSFPASRLALKKYTVEFCDRPSIARSLGLMSPVEVVWELIPYSFVFDWFLPIGTYLENLSAIGSIDGRVMGSTYLKGETAFARWNYIPYQRQYVTRRTGRILTVSRTVTSTIPVTRPPWHGASGLLSKASRIKNAVALAHQLITR